MTGRTTKTERTYKSVRRAGKKKKRRYPMSGRGIRLLLRLLQKKQLSK